MQSLRATYKTLQRQAYDRKPIFPTRTKANAAIKQAEEAINAMQVTNDFQNYDETVFYKEKFEALHEITMRYEKKKMGRDLYQDQIKALLAKDYAGISMVESKINVRASNEPVVVPATLGYRTKTKSPLKEFFDDQEVKNSTNKVMFSNILSRQQTPLKYGLKSTIRSRSPANNNNLSEAELRRLREQNERLRNQLDADRSVGSGQDQVRELRSQISQLSQENRRLKIQVSSRTGTRSDYVIEEQYDPYNIKVRENNIMRINSRNLTLSEKTSQFGQDYSQPAKGSHIYFDNQSVLARSNFTHNPARYQTKRLQPSSQQVDLLNASHSTIQTQLLNLDQSQLNDEEKNHVCREKIAFFKKSMVLYKSQDFDIAFKRSDLNPELDRLRIILYVNNKTPSRVDCKIQYDFEREDFDLVVNKKLERVEGRGQGREQIEVYLKNATDLSSLINAKVLVGSVMKKLVIPALFIDFDPIYKQQFQNIGYIERNLSQPLIIKPMGQFSSLQNASNILQLTPQYDSRHPEAKLYGKSKVTKGIVRLTWKNDKLRIETCEDWKTLMGYLFLNAEETIVY